MRRATCLLAAMLLMSIVAGCEDNPPTVRIPSPKSMSVTANPAAPAGEPIISDAMMATAVRKARESVKKALAPGHDSVAYVQAFDESLRPEIEKLTGRHIPALQVDTRSTARPLYDAYEKMFAHRVDTSTYIGDPVAGAKHKEAVSLLSHQNEQCSGVVIGKNAIVTARHCTENVSDNVYSGPTTGVGLPIKIDSSAFKPLKDINGVDLDLAILVQKDALGGDVADTDMPVFASTKMIDAATEWTLVGYGGNQDTGGAGIKRLGTVPNLDASCSGIGVAKAYGCTPGEEIVAGSRPFEEREQHGACAGDSGGPVYVEVAGKLYLAAIIRAITDPNDCAKTTNVYVRLDKQLPDLRKISGIDIPKTAFAEFDKP